MVPATYPVPIVRSTMAELRRALEAFRQRQRGRYAIWVEELHSGQVIDLDGRRPMDAAAVYSLFLAAYCTAEAAAGRLDLTQLVEYTSCDRMTGLGRLQEASCGERFSLGQLCQYAVADGDLTAGRMLRRALDPGALQAWAATTDLGEVQGDRLSPQQAATLLKLALRFAEDGTRQSGALLEALLASRHTNWAPRLLPWSVPTAHLTGALPQHLHDVGVVFQPRGAYLLAIMSDLSADPRLGVGIDNLAQIGGIVYRHLRLIDGMLGKLLVAGQQMALRRPLALLEDQPTLDGSGAALALGAHLETDGLSGVVTLTRGLHRVTLHSDQLQMVVGTEKRPLPFAPFPFEGELILPLLPVAAALGRRVDWDAARNLAHVEN